MSSFVRPLLTRRCRIIVPFLFAYGLGLYLVAGAISDAFSGQSAHPRSELVIERSGKPPGQPSTNASDTAKAVRAVEDHAGIRDLSRGQRISIGRAGPWTGGDNPTDAAPAPLDGVGVAMRVDLPSPVDVDLRTEPGSPGTAGDARSSQASGESEIVHGVSSLVVLYDPALDEIVSILPVPEEAPSIVPDVGPPPAVAPPETRSGGNR